MSTQWIIAGMTMILVIIGAAYGHMMSENHALRLEIQKFQTSHIERSSANEAAVTLLTSRVDDLDGDLEEIDDDIDRATANLVETRGKTRYMSGVANADRAHFNQVISLVWDKIFLGEPPYPVVTYNPPNVSELDVGVE